MNEQQKTGPGSRIGLILGSLLGVLVGGGVIGFIIYSSICPCERTPGGFLFGDSAEEVAFEELAFAPTHTEPARANVSVLPLFLLPPIALQLLCVVLVRCIP